MGLDYSISTFVTRAKLADSLNWLSERLYDNGDSKHIKLDEDYIKISGSSFRDHKGKLNDSSIDFAEGFCFNTSLIFDIDPVIINSLCDQYPHYFDINIFKEDFENYYLGNGKIQMGGFDSEIIKLEKYDVYHITFMAATTAISQMLIDSLSVRNWIEEFSQASASIASYIDMEHHGHKILFYKDQKIDITISDPYDVPQDITANFFDEYFKLIQRK